MMRAGDLDRRIVLRTLTEQPAGAYGMAEVLGAAREVWARHEPVHGLTLRAGMQTGEAPTDLFFVRYGAGTRPHDIDATYIIEYQGRRYRVMDAIDHEGRREFTRLTTKDLGPSNA